MEFSSEEKDHRALYKLLIGCVTPRPIGWISTIDGQGQANLAPYSFFNGVTPNPPVFAFSALDRRDGSLKDTAANLWEVPECVIHIVSEELSAQMNDTCADFHAGVDEFSESGLHAVPSAQVKPPRIREALAAFECRVLHHLRLGRRPPHSSHIVVEALHWHLDARIVDESGAIIADALRTIGRMGGSDYVRTSQRFSLERPTLAKDDPRALHTS